MTENVRRYIFRRQNHVHVDHIDSLRAMPDHHRSNLETRLFEPEHEKKEHTDLGHEKPMSHNSSLTLYCTKALWMLIARRLTQQGPLHDEVLAPPHRHQLHQGQTSRGGP